MNKTTKGLFRKAGGSWAFFFFFSGGSAPPPAPPPAPPGDILDGNGQVSSAAYLAMAYDYDSYVTYRFGSPASLTGVQTLNERADTGSINHGGSNNMPFQFGPENNSDPNLYMSIHAVAVGKPVSGNSIADAVIWFQNFAVDRETAQQRPFRLWQDNVLLPPAFRSSGVYRTMSNPIVLNSDAYLPVCSYRGENAPDSPNTRLSIIATMGSPTVQAMLLTAGTYTAKNPASCRLPLGYRPTGIAVTGAGEAALVTCWDTVNTRGRLLVVALGSAPEGVAYTATGPSARYDWWHGWRDNCKPFFSDQGNIVFMKVVADLDLGTTCKAPTDVVCTTGVHPYTSALKYGPGGIDNFQQLDSPMADNRAKMLSGGEDYERYAKGGVAQVTSLSEGTVVFVDLGPCFAYVNDMYLGSAAKNLETQNLGFAANQWPYPLTGSALPVVAKTIQLPAGDKPVAGWMTPTFNEWSKDDQERQAPPNDMYWQDAPHFPKSAVATRGGKLFIYSLGRYAAGVKPTTPAPADIAQVGSLTGLGNNITHIAANKGVPSINDDLNDGLVVTARGDRAFILVTLTTQRSGKVMTGVTASKTTLVQDSRVDAISCCLVDPYHTESNILTAADWTGQCVRNYRYGPIIYGGDTVWEPAPLNTPAASPPGEYCGKIDLPFRPVNVHCSNTP